MGELIKAYGGSIRDAIIVSAVIGLIIMGIGLGSRLSAYAVGEEHTGGDHLANAMERSMERPVYDIRMKKMLRRWEKADAKELFDYGDTEPDSVRIIEVLDHDGEDVTDSVCQGDGSVVFSDEGVYRMLIHIQDKNGIVSIRKVYLGVSSK